MSINPGFLCKAKVLVSMRSTEAVGRVCAVYYGHMDDDTAQYHLKRARGFIVEALEALDEALASDKQLETKIDA